MKLLLNPARFRWLDRLPAWPRFRKRGKHHADGFDIVPRARHASSERIACGGLSRGTLPRREPGETRVHLIDRGPDRAPWLTGELAVLAGECRPTDAQTLELYQRGDWGVVPQQRAAEAERLPQVIA